MLIVFMIMFLGCYFSQLYSSYIQKHSDIIMELERHAKKSPEFEKACKEFEVRSFIYLWVFSLSVILFEVNFSRIEGLKSDDFYQLTR